VRIVAWLDYLALAKKTRSPSWFYAIALVRAKVRAKVRANVGPNPEPNPRHVLQVLPTIGRDDG
jgi:hypothetical protein